MVIYSIFLIISNRLAKWTVLDLPPSQHQQIWCLNRVIIDLNTVSVISGVLCSGCVDPSTDRVHAHCNDIADFSELLPMQYSATHIYIESLSLNI